MNTLNKANVKSTSSCVFLGQERKVFGAAFLLPLSIVLIALLYTSLFNPLHLSINSSLPSDNSQTKPSSSSKANLLNQNNKDALTSKPKLTFIDRLNQTLLEDLITLRFTIDLNRTASNPKKNNFDRNTLKLDDLNRFISVQLLPRLNSIVNMDYFRYIKLNLNRKCSLWPDDTRCSLKGCSIQTCDESTLPRYLKTGDESDWIATHPPADSSCEQQQHLQSINTTLPLGQENTMDSIFECHLNEYEDGQYYDLQINPERFTGYAGHSSHRVWKSIYEENCFKTPRLHRSMDPIFVQSLNSNPFSTFNSSSEDNANDLCFEEHFFYKAISGLHTSINLHLCSSYHFKNGSFGYNLPEFVKRFEGKEDYLRNLYFVFMLEWRALQKVESYLMSKVNWASSGDQLQTREAIRNLLQIGKKFGAYFDDEQLLSKKQFLSSEFKVHFQNISSTIMDCVACDKCRLWGKVQIHALGTAFKILLTDQIEIENLDESKSADKFHLHRHQISTLLNGLTRLSTSIYNLEIFNRLMKGEAKPNNLLTDSPAYSDSKPTSTYFKIP